LCRKETKFTIILDELKTKIRNLNEILDKVGDFGRTKMTFSTKYFLPAAQYKISADIKAR